MCIKGQAVPSQPPEDERLNLLSAAFDPSLALLVDQVKVPFPEEKALNNLSECRHLLPEGAASAGGRHFKAGSKHVAAQRQAKADNEGSTSGSASTEPAQGSASTEHAASTSLALPAAASKSQSLSGQWATSFTEGPLHGLRALQRQRVRVLVRRQHGLRGWYEGQLQLMDRHWNLLLKGVTEHVVCIDRSADIDSSQAEWEKRHIGQVLVRGDSVVSVCGLPRQPLSRRARESFFQLAEASARSGIRSLRRCQVESPVE